MILKKPNQQVYICSKEFYYVKITMTKTKYEMGFTRSPDWDYGKQF